MTFLTDKTAAPVNSDLGAQGTVGIQLNSVQAAIRRGNGNCAGPYLCGRAAGSRSALTAGFAGLRPRAFNTGLRCLSRPVDSGLFHLGYASRTCSTWVALAG